MHGTELAHETGGFQIFVAESTVTIVEVNGGNELTPDFSRSRLNSPLCDSRPDNMAVMGGGDCEASAGVAE